MKPSLQALLQAAVTRLIGTRLPDAPPSGTVEVERTDTPSHGDFTSPVAMRLAGIAKTAPRALAQAIVDALPQNDLIAHTEIAGAGFINFFLSPEAYARELKRMHLQGERYGRSALGQGERVVLELPSVDPTSALTLHQGREAVYGATLARLLSAVGFEVSCECRLQDAGPEVEHRAVAAWLAYLVLLGEPLPFLDKDPGELVHAQALALKAHFGDRLRRPASALLAGLREVPQAAPGVDLNALLKCTRTLLGEDFASLITAILAPSLAGLGETLAQIDARPPHWCSERSLLEEGPLERALSRLESRGHLHSRKGTVWFRATALGEASDPILIREDGTKTAFAADLASLLDKRERGFGRLIMMRQDPGRLLQAALAMGEPLDGLEVRRVSPVRLQGGKKSAHRPGPLLLLHELLDEVGPETCRFFYLMSSPDQPLNFDLDLAHTHRCDNPLYCIQYAHARVVSARSELNFRGLRFDLEAGLHNLALLRTPQEQVLLRTLTCYPEVLEEAALQRSPDVLVHYLLNLAQALHAYHFEAKWIVPEEPLRQGRLALVLGVQQVLRNGLTLLGVSASDSV